MTSTIMHTQILRLAAWAMLIVSASVSAQTPGYLRHPAIGPQGLVFTAEGDLWRTSLEGGAATRLTSHPDAETHAAVSPEGTQVAFSASFEGPTEVYVMPLSGGVPKRLTFEGEGALVQGWTADGRVIYSTHRVSATMVRQLALVDPKTRKTELLPVHKAAEGALDARGRLAFTRDGLRGDNARRYKGGAMAQIWLMDTKAQAEARALTTEKDGNNSQPMWWGERIVFVSDRSGARNLWVMNADGSQPRALTRHAASGFDLRQARLHGNRVVYALGASVRVLELESGNDRSVAVQLVSDFDQLRERWAQKPLNQFTAADLNPTGDRVVVTARGQVLVAGPQEARRVELVLGRGERQGLQAGVRAREAKFSHDGKHIFYFGDASGEQELMMQPSNGSGTATQLTADGNATRIGLSPSPDGKWVLHHDWHGRLYLTDVAAKKTETLETIRGQHDSYVWAPDSLSFVMTRAARPGWVNDVMYLVRLADKKPQALTTDRYDARYPAFTPDQRWLYFVSDRTLNPTPGSPWGSRNMGPSFDKRDKIYALALQPGNRWPFRLPDELPEAKPSTPGSLPTTATTTATTATSASATAKLPEIVAAALDRRLFEVPSSVVAPANMRGLATDGKRLFYATGDNWQGWGSRATLYSVAIDATPAPAEVHSTEVRRFALSANAKKLLVVRGAEAPEFGLFDAAPKPPSAPHEVVKTSVRMSDWQILQEPALEWRQMFADAWRMHRDHFYDRAMHGTDWVGVRNKYEVLLPQLTDRYELSDLLAQMVAEINALHSQVFGGDLRETPTEIAHASLGARLEPVTGGLRIAQIYRTEWELPSARGPLAQPGMDVRVGDVITAINHTPTAGRDAGDLLRAQAGKSVLFNLQRGEEKLQIVTTPLPVSRERALRLADWQLANRERVENASDGKFGYLHLRAMGGNDLSTFAREFYPAVEREGLIVDVRGNGGGSISSYLTNALMRRAWGFWHQRVGGTYPNQQNAFRGPIVVLVDQDTYSDGETFAEGIKRMGLATLIGRRTSGAGVWLSDRNALADGGMARAAETGQFALDGTWLIEGKGVVPDIEIDNLPRATAAGGDAQLDAAIEYLKKSLAQKPLPEIRVPAHPKM